MLSFSTQLLGQQYQIFTYNNRYGLVNAQNLQEFIAPQAKMITPFGQQYYIMTPQDSIYIYHKQTGKKSAYKKSTTGWGNLSVADTQYLAIETDGKMQLLSSNLNVINLQANYSRVELFNASYKRLCAWGKNTFDIYHFEQNKATLKLSMNASSRINLDLVYEHKEQPIYIFYGLDTIYTVDTLGRLLHKYASNTTHTDEILQAIRPQFTQAIQQEYYGTNEGPDDGERDDFYTAKLAKWTVLKSTEEEKHYGTYGVPYALVLPQDAYLHYNRINKTFELQDKKNSCKFHFDAQKGKILLPVAYQQKLGIKVKPFIVKETDDSTVYSFHNTPAQPSKAWLDLMAQTLNLTILDGIVDNKDMSVLVYVNQDGSISNFKCSRSVRDEALQQNIINFLNNNRTGWKPAVLTGLKVRSYYTIKFKMNNP